MLDPTGRTVAAGIIALGLEWVYVLPFPDAHSEYLLMYILFTVASRRLLLILR